MTKIKDNVSAAAPDIATTPPDTQTGAGTSEVTAALATQPASGDKPVESAAPESSNEEEQDEEPEGPQPGSADFDAEAPGVRAYEIEEHIRILEARKKLKALINPVESPTPAPVPVTVVDAPQATQQPEPTGDIRAVNEAGEVRYFNQITWDSMAEGDKHGGWEVSVAEPSKDLK